MATPDKGMRISELVGRLAVLGIPAEVTRSLTMRQIHGIFMTLTEWLNPEPDDDEPIGNP